MTGFLRFFRRFPQINIGGDFAHFPPLEDAPMSVVSLARKRVGCDSMSLTCQTNMIKQLAYVPFIRTSYPMLDVKSFSLICTKVH